MGNKFQNNKPSIGLIINNAVGFYQSMLTKAVFQCAEDRNVNLVLFNGGNLDLDSSHDHDFNQIYHMAPYARLDGLILSSTLGNIEQMTSYQKLVETMYRIPTVTVGYRIDKIPTVLVDNYGGMKSVVSHLIEAHQYRKIAFVAGPKGNLDAEERFQAYQDALQDANIKLDPTIIYPGHFFYDDGLEFGKKISALKNIPFHAVVFANDDMAIAAMKVFRSKNISLPKDLAITGFDDIPEADFNYHKLTTVRKSTNDEAAAALGMVLDIINGKEVPAEKFIQTQVVIRESCGCSPLRGTKAAHIRRIQSEQGELKESDTRFNIEKKLLLNKSTIIENILNQLTVDETVKNDLRHAISAFIDMAIFDLKNLRSQPMTLMILDEWLEISLEWNNFSENWQNMIHLLQVNISVYITDPDQSGYLDDLTQQMLTNVTKWIPYLENRHYIKLYQFLSEYPATFGRINSELDRNNIIAILRKELKNIDLKKVFIVLFKSGPFSVNPFDAGKEGELVLAIDNNNDLLSSGNSIIFPLADILPDEVIQQRDRYSILLMGLFCRQEHFGYIGLAINGLPSISLYVMREQISNALYSSEIFKRYKESEGKMQITVDQLRLKEEYQRDILMNLPFLIFETDAELNITYMNNTTREYMMKGELKVPEVFSIVHFLSLQDQGLVKKAASSEGLAGSIQLTDVRLVHPKTNKPVPVIKIDKMVDLNGRTTGFRWSALDLESLLNFKTLSGEEFTQHYRISKREKDVMDLVVQGYRKKDIAQKLYIAENTVKGHIADLYDKLGVNNRSALIELLNRYYTDHFGWNAYAFNLFSRLFNSLSTTD